MCFDFIKESEDPLCGLTYIQYVTNRDEAFASEVQKWREKCPLPDFKKIYQKIHQKLPAIIKQQPVAFPKLYTFI